MRWLIAGACLVATSGVARAELLSMGAWAQVHATVLHDMDDSEGAPNQIAFIGIRGDSFLYNNPAIHITFDLDVGATIGDGGFYYQASVLPLGVGLGPIGDGSGVAIGTGVSFVGATSTLDDSIGLPVDIAFEAQMGDRARLMAGVRGTFIAGADARQGGASLPGIDELDARLALRFGSGIAGYGGRFSQGWFGGVSYKEMLGDKYVGITLGFSSDNGLTY